MGVAKVIAKKGNGVDKPKRGDVVYLEYAGYIYDPSHVGRGYRGRKFHTSRWLDGERFGTKIGVGKVIKGWDEGIIYTEGGMSLGELATFTITSDYAYEDLGFPQWGIPPNTNLIFDVKLVAINGRTA